MSTEETRKIGLGIDTGGTFTDAALVDLETSKVIAKAKAPTSYQDLTIGMLSAIDAALSQTSISPSEVRLVGLSTTLATNSILQGKGGKVGLIGIGWTPQSDWQLGTDKVMFVRGGFDSMGKQLEPLDTAGLVQAIDALAPEVDAYVVSGMFSICNPTDEENAREMIAKRTGKPVVVGHSLTTELGVKERTVTAVLNAKLLPVISEFLSSVSAALSAKGVNGRILVFKGDGGLMTMESAKERPVETVLSGPAASLVGGKALSGLNTCLVVDVGGTSTDIAFLDDGFPRLSTEGAIVGGWKTRVKAISMWTVGLGGDSLVSVDDSGDLTIGPHRVVPLASAAPMRPGLATIIRERQETTFYVAGKGNLSALTESERLIYDFILKSGPVTFYEIMDGVRQVILVKDNLEALMARANVLRTGLTPTDVMNVLGIYTPGNADASKAGLDLLAEKTDANPEDLARKILERTVTRVGEEVVRKIVEDQEGDIPNERVIRQMLHALIGEKTFSGLSIKASVDRPLIAIGAPAKELIGPLSERMGVQVVIPENYDVGNAVGAVLSEISESMTVQVYPTMDKFLVLSPLSSPMQYSHIEEAITSAKRTAETHVQSLVELAGAEDVRVRTEVIENRFSDGYGKEMKFVNWIDVRATALGKPRLDR
ncbi:MAG TPA: hydantoinase/oxoprolinase family protein [Methanomassiliicoccales archaeon]|nr:hydantoinase/oxoprolinase family protein [Methanomassiliicoccales archaeon]